MDSNYKYPDVNYERELEILKLIRKLIEDRIHGTILYASLDSKREVIIRIMPLLDKIHGYIVNHHKIMPDSDTKKNFMNLDKLFDAYRRGCDKIIKNGADIQSVNDLGARFSDITDCLKVIETHVNTEKVKLKK